MASHFCRLQEKGKHWKLQKQGRRICPVKQPIKVLDHDFPIAGNGKAVPYGIYDINRNEGYVNVGVSSDTAQFAVHSIEEWWKIQWAKYVTRKRHPCIYVQMGAGAMGAATNFGKGITGFR